MRINDLYNITNFNSTCIKIECKFKRYNIYHLHAYINIGVIMCIASKYVFSQELWTTILKESIISVWRELESVTTFRERLEKVHPLMGHPGPYI